jgi:hypothetical protein
MIPDDVRETIHNMLVENRYNLTGGDALDYEGRLVQDWLDVQPTMPQPDWSSAPEWAMWWAVDPDSIAYWSEEKPLFQFGYWYCGTDRHEKAGYCTLDLGLDHRQTLRRRPEGEQ